MAIKSEIENATRHIEKEVGDGTTSTVILSSLIFDKLTRIENKHKIPPYQLIRLFKKVVDDIKEDILNNGRECTIEDIYNIAMVSTNGNTEVATNIKNIYEEYGMNVELSVGISNSPDSLVKIYDGLTITEGMSDPVFINNKSNNTAEIYNASVYHFADPIDTMEMIGLFESILKHNIYDPYENDEDPIPTVITCPRLSRDMSAILKQLANQLYQFDSQSAESQKPPILIITDVVASDEIIMDDIANLCGCKTIRKYIDPKVYEKDVEAGVAATADNVWEFAGHSEKVIADSKKTKFINPEHMKVSTEEGTVEEDPIYTAMINFLETEIETSKGTNDANNIGMLKKRLAALKANMVDYLVGGVTIAERDAVKDLVEDAIKNCKSASLYGVGYAANYEALRSSYNTLVSRSTEYDNDSFESEILIDIAECIFSSYIDISTILYSTVEMDKDKVKEYVYQSIDNNMPYDISSGLLPDDIKDNSGSNILCSIKLDINILDTLSKIITIMVTCNQCLLQNPALNLY